MIKADIEFAIVQTSRLQTQLAQAALGITSRRRLFRALEWWFSVR
jgi:hypothetical protein